MAKDYMPYSDLVGYKAGCVAPTRGWRRSEMSTNYYGLKPPITHLELIGGVGYNVLEVWVSDGLSGVLVLPKSVIGKVLQMFADGEGEGDFGDSEEPRGKRFVSGKQVFEHYGVHVDKPVVSRSPWDVGEEGEN